MESTIKLGASGFAELLTSNESSWARKLRPFKFSKKGEGAGRSSYYRRALHAIRAYHQSGGDKSTLRKACHELALLRDASLDRRDRTKCQRNIDAIAAYEQIYGRRNFEILPNHRISYSIGPVRITAQPDLWVAENGQQVLLKIGVAKKKPEFVEVLLYLIRKATINSGHRIRARNIVYLDITNGRELCCDTRLNRFNRSFRNAAKDIALLWPSVELPGLPEQQVQSLPDSR